MTGQMVARQCHGVDRGLENPRRRLDTCHRHRRCLCRTGFRAELGLLWRLLSGLRLPARLRLRAWAALRLLPHV